MIEEIGTVVELHGTQALVRTARSSACAGCSSAGFCQMSDEGDECTVEAENSLHAGVGEKVRIAIPTSSFLKGIFLLYLFPLIGLFSGMIAGYVLAEKYFTGKTDNFAAVGAIIGLLIFFVLQRLINRKIEQDPRYRPVVVKVLQ